VAYFHKVARSERYFTYKIIPQMWNILENSKSFSKSRRGKMIEKYGFQKVLASYRLISVRAGATPIACWR
jgi:hypothetical protein